jgi:hypothetical protein
MRLLLNLWYAVRQALAALARIERKVDRIMGLVEDVDAATQAIEDTMTALEGAETELVSAVDSLRDRLGDAGLPADQVAAIEADLARISAVGTRLTAAKDSVSGVKDSLDAIDPAAPPAGGGETPPPAEGNPAALPVQQSGPINA